MNEKVGNAHPTKELFELRITNYELLLCLLNNPITKSG